MPHCSRKGDEGRGSPVTSGEGRQKRKACLDESILQILSLKLGLCLSVHMVIEITSSILCRHAHVTSKKQHHRHVPYSEKERACRIGKKQSEATVENMTN